MMLWIIFAVLLVCTDLAIKYTVRHHEKSASETPEKNTILGGTVTLTKYCNKGAVFGIFKEHSKELLAVSLLFFGMLIGMFLMVSGKKENFVLKTGLMLLLGGAGSNVYERYVHGEVTDYIQFNFGGRKFRQLIFNLGDFFILIGAVLTCIGFIKKK